MARIIMLDEAVNHRIAKCHKHVGDSYHRSVRPVYASIKGAHPELIGSCVLIALEDRKFIVTAAHVVDWSDTHSLYVAGRVGTEPMQMLGTIYQTKHTGGRNSDKYDTAFWRVSEADVTRLGDVKFLSKSDFGHNKVPPSGRLFMTVGYPLSRNKNKIDYSEKTIRSLAWRYTGPVENIPELSKKLGVSGEDHLFLKFNKNSTKLYGGKVSSINPRGISGGALIDIGNFSDMTEYADGRECKGLLAGMIIEKNKKHRALIAIKIQYIVDAITKIVL